MSHHGSTPFDDDDAKKAASARLRSCLDTTSFRGAIGDFPEGQLNKSDEGAIQFGITAKDGKVILDFGTPVAWVGMSAQQAADLASVLLTRAREAGRQKGEMVTITIGGGR
jgi:hypothetical protein